MRFPGYDVYTLRRVGSLPESLITRLKSDDQFQGARYEIAVAAVFADYDAPSRDRGGHPPGKSSE
jgi:hypothetical protein